MYFFPSSAASIGLVLLQPVEVFQEQQPGGLLGVVEFGGAAGLFPEDVVDVFEGLFKHGHYFLKIVVVMVVLVNTLRSYKDSVVPA